MFGTIWEAAKPSPIPTTPAFSAGSLVNILVSPVLLVCALA